MRLLHWVVIVVTLGAFVLATLFLGWPRTFEQAGGFASFVAAILTPASLLLVVASLEKQEAQQRQATRDGFLSVQVQALIALIEDDRVMLADMAEKYRKDKTRTEAFIPVKNRCRQRVAKLNQILGGELRLPELAER